jgi:hypothetical protein
MEWTSTSVPGCSGGKKESISITGLARLQTKTLCGGCCSTRISVSHTLLCHHSTRSPGGGEGDAGKGVGDGEARLVQLEARRRTVRVHRVVLHSTHVAASGQASRIGSCHQIRVRCSNSSRSMFFLDDLGWFHDAIVFYIFHQGPPRALTHVHPQELLKVLRGSRGAPAGRHLAPARRSGLHRRSAPT